MAPNVPAVELAERLRVGATVREFRERAGWRADQFANEIGISRPYLSNIEAGRKPITKKLVGRISVALNIPQIAIVRPDVFADQEGAA